MGCSPKFIVHIHASKIEICFQQRGRGHYDCASVLENHSLLTAFWKRWKIPSNITQLVTTDTDFFQSSLCGKSSQLVLQANFGDTFLDQNLDKHFHYFFFKALTSGCMYGKNTFLMSLSFKEQIRSIKIGGTPISFSDVCQKIFMKQFAYGDIADSWSTPPAFLMWAKFESGLCHPFKTDSRPN